MNNKAIQEICQIVRNAKNAKNAKNTKSFSAVQDFRYSPLYMIYHAKERVQLSDNALPGGLPGRCA